MPQSLESLRAMSSRNRNLNAAYAPQWEQPAANPLMGVDPGMSGNTSFDPFMGSGWGTWLDMAGAGDPGGMKMAGSALPKSPLALSQQDPEDDINPALVGMKKATANRRARKEFPGASHAV